MAISRQQNWLGQQRVDLPHLRSLESAVSNDFDVLAGKMLSGKTPLILKGFTIPVTNTIGTAVTSLQLNVAGGLLMHFGASDSGTIFSVSDSATAETLTSTNTKVSGSFVAGVTNYVGLDLVRGADSTTSDLVQFLDANTKLEIGQTVPLARTLNYKIIISTQNFTVSSNVAPIAKIVTSSTNTVVSITDARRLMFRLGSGADNPNAVSSYAWGTRTENALTFTGASDPFVGEDKSINNLKSWMDALMTSVWEVKGGEHWFSSTSRDNVKVLYGPVSILTDNFTFAANTLRWESLVLGFENADNSGVYFNSVLNNTSGVSFNTDGMCLYVDLTRESNATNIPATVGNLQTLGSSTIPGRRIILAWRVGGQVFTRDRPYEIGRALVVATTTTVGVVKLSRAASTPSSPIVISDQGAAIAAPAASNSDGISATGDGTGAGLRGIGGATNASGVIGRGTGNGVGVVGIGDTGSGSGGNFTGGATNGKGVVALGIGTGVGGDFTGGASVGGHGLLGTAGAGGGTGVTGQGSDTGSGIAGTGGANGHGVVGVAGSNGGANLSGVTGSVHASATNGNGGNFLGKGTGYGVQGTGGSTGVGGKFTNGAGNTADAIQSIGHVDMSGGDNPTSTTAFTDRITRKNFTKAWVSFTCNNTTTPTLHDGFNITSVAQNITGGQNALITITFASSFANTNYCPLVFCFQSASSPSTNEPWTPYVSAVNNGSIVISAYRRHLTTLGNAPVSADTTDLNGYRFSVQIVGAQ